MFSNLIVAFLGGFFAFQISVAIEDFPPYFPRCPRSSPHLEECLIAATEEVKPYMKKGVPDFFVPLENFTIPEIVMEQGNRAVNFKAVLSNLTLFGLEKYKFTRYHYQVENGTFFIDVELPELSLKGKYSINGNIFFAPIRGSGDFYANIVDARCSVYHTTELIRKNDVEYIHPLDTVPKMHIGKVVDYGFGGLFSDNKDLELATKNVIQNNMDVIIEELSPAIEKVLGSIFDSFIFKQVTRVPYEKLYPK